MDRLYRHRTLIALAVLAMAAAMCLSCARTASNAAAITDAAPETILVRNLETPGSFEVENRGPAIAMYSQVIVQEMVEGKWQDRATDLILSETCDWNPKAGCRTLGQGAKLRPPAWNGLICSGQCPLGCRANAYLGPGSFRFVVMSCDQKQRFYGPAFTMPDYDHSQLKKKEG